MTYNSADAPMNVLNDTLNSDDIMVKLTPPPYNHCSSSLPSASLSYYQEERLFADSVYESISLSRPISLVIDTPQFQRLRRIKQLGGCEFVYYSANHSRFAHSIGVASLAKKWVGMLREKQPELNITNTDILCVQLAALCHDIGHGPFSHLFDGSFMSMVIRKYDVKEWQHELLSVRMFRHLLLKNPEVKEELETIWGLTPSDFIFIEEAIYGGPTPQDMTTSVATDDYQGRPPSKWFLYDIVNNIMDGFDVDKFDYFLRDSKATSVNIDFDLHTLHRLLHNIRVYNVEGRSRICYAEKVKKDLATVGRSRYRLHDCVYQHKTVKACEAIITEAFVQSDSYFKVLGENGREYRLSEAVQDMNAYEKLDDGLLELISRNNGSVEAQKTVAKLVERLKKRQLDRLVGHTNCAGLTLSKQKLSLSTIADEIVQSYNRKCDMGAQISTSDINVLDATIHRGMQDENPLTKVFVYNHKNLHERPRRVDVMEYLGENPGCYSLRRIYVFGRYGLAEEKMTLLIDVFGDWCKQYRITPQKRMSASRQCSLSPQPEIKLARISLPMSASQ